jgi:alpha-galactosidase
VPTLRLGSFEFDLSRPLVEVLVSGQGSMWSGERAIETAVGARLTYQGHDQQTRDGWRELRINLRDPVTGLAARLHLEAPAGIPAVRSWVELTNTGPDPLTVQAVTSMVHYGFESPDMLTLHWADNEWLAECRWQQRPLREVLPDLNREAHQHDPRGCFAIGGRGSWSTARYLPSGVLTSSNDAALGWQVEHSGGWRWEVGARGSGYYLTLLGPTDEQNQWRRHLAPGDSFTSVPAALVQSAAGFDGAMAELTRYRRRIRRPHTDHSRLPVIFNDYMNTLMGDPTTGKLLPLVDAAADVGAEYFCVDAGWYDDDATGWWDAVGAWEPASGRFPNGIKEVLDRIRDRGMVPGLWLEPEVIGVRSAVAAALPDEAFFRRDGVRLVEHGRHQLDFRHPAARAHLDKVVDRLVSDLGIGYLKLDHNIDAGAGTQVRADSPGAGLHDHILAYYQWLDDILDRHPELVVESCASGGLRMDYGLLARSQLVSTSDQQDFLRYPPIAASAPTAALPEQAAVWAYPQPDFTADEIAFTLCGALLGRVHLSGFLDQMSSAQRALVRDAIEVYGEIRQDIAHAVPFWPLGLPQWTSEWLALGIRTDDVTYLTVWRRGGPSECQVSLPEDAGNPEILYPRHSSAALHWDSGSRRLTVDIPRTPMAVLIRISPAGQ